MSLEELNAKVASLTALVEKQSKVIALTGQKLMELQVQDVREKIRTHDPKPQENLDYITNEDIVQLVSELQGQLDEYEARSIKRLYNSKIIDDSGELAPISNKDGDFPPEFPKTLGEFKDISVKRLVELALFYEILVPEELTKAAQEQILGGQEVTDFTVTDELVESFKGQNGDELFKELAQWLGLSVIERE